MTYTGQVGTGGPSAVRELERLTIRKASVSEMDNNVYLLTCVDSGEQLLVDAADDAPRIRRLVDEGTGSLSTVVTTHKHWDHHRALADVVRQGRVRTMAGADDAPELPVPVDTVLEHGDTVTFGHVALDVVALRGHTPGSVALAYSDPSGSVHLFTGDSLFPGGAGRTTSPEDFRSLMDDLGSRVFDVYGDDAWVYPGHGDDTTLGAERPHLAEWRERGW